MRLDKFDLNLLLTLDALLEERNVSRAAVKLHLTQPAVSNALGKLRQYFNDPLLVRVGGGMGLTQFASQLRAPLAQTLIQVRGLISSRAAFDPLTCTAKLVIAASDWFAVTHIAPLVRKLARIAPLMQIEHRAISPQARDRMAAGAIDLLVMREERLLPDHPSRFLTQERLAVIGCRRLAPFHHPRLTMAELAPYPQILALAAEDDPLMPQFHRFPARERIIAMTSSVSLLPEMVADTQYVALMPEPAARHYARSHPIRCATISDAPPSLIHFQWHKQRHDDPTLDWACGQFEAIQEEIKG